MSRRIQVSPNTVTITDGDTKIQADTEDVCRAYYGPTYERVDLGLMPSGLRWMSANRRTFAVERPAQTELVNMTFPGVFDTLPMPYRLLFVTFDEKYSQVTAMQMGFSRRPIQTLAEELSPFPGTDTLLAIPIPPTLQVSGGASGVGPYLTQVWEHLHVNMRQMWTRDGQRELNRSVLPQDYAIDDETGYQFANFVAWWATQSVDQVCDWVYVNNTKVSLKVMLGELDPPPSWTSTWDFFNDIVAQAAVHTEIRLEKERVAAEERRRRAAGLREQRIATIAAQVADGSRHERTISEILAEMTAKAEAVAAAAAALEVAEPVRVESVNVAADTEGSAVTARPSRLLGRPLDTTQWDDWLFMNDEIL